MKIIRTGLASYSVFDGSEWVGDAVTKPGAERIKHAYKQALKEAKK